MEITKRAHGRTNQSDSAPRRNLKLRRSWRRNTKATTGRNQSILRLEGVDLKIFALTEHDGKVPQGIPEPLAEAASHFVKDFYRCFGVGKAASLPSTYSSGDFYRCFVVGKAAFHYTTKRVRKSAVRLFLGKGRPRR